MTSRAPAKSGTAYVRCDMCAVDKFRRGYFPNPGRKHDRNSPWGRLPRAPADTPRTRCAACVRLHGWPAPGSEPEAEPVPFHRRPLAERLADPDVQTFHTELERYLEREGHLAAQRIAAQRPRTSYRFGDFYAAKRNA